MAGGVRTYAPRGHSPVLYVPLTRDHLSVIRGITAQGRLLVPMQARAFNGAEVAGFLAHLVSHIRGKLLIIWDGAPIHRDTAVKAFLAEGPRGQLWLEQLPG